MFYQKRYDERLNDVIPLGCRLQGVFIIGVSALISAHIFKTQNQLRF